MNKDPIAQQLGSRGGKAFVRKHGKKALKEMAIKREAAKKQRALQKG